MNVELVVIDPQNSFCASVPPTDQQTLHNGELCVPGAGADMDRLAGMVKKWGRKFSGIVKWCLPPLYGPSHPKARKHRIKSLLDIGPNGGIRPPSPS